MTIEPSLVVWTVLCFLALMLILKKLLFQPMLTFMDARSAKIETARRAKTQAQAEREAELHRLADERTAEEARQREAAAAALAAAHEELMRCTAEKRADAERRLAEYRAALDKESESICRELEPQLSDLAIDLVNQLQKWQDDRHSAVDAETVAAPYADMDHLPVSEHPKATTNRTM